MGEQSQTWFVALLKRLRSLCEITKDRFIQEASLKDQFHYHDIKWDHAPIDRKDFDWVDQEIIENENEYPFFQFSVSQSLGRVVGFFEGPTFFVLLLDPAHNIYLTKYSNYKVTNTTIGRCDFSGLLEKTEAIVSLAIDHGVNIPEHIWCGARGYIASQYSNLVVARVDDDTVHTIDQLISLSAADGTADIVSDALKSYADQMKDIV
ncbi:hypothetical protein GCM10007853_29890 [Algimonas ampicilliniresistens]|uniref:Uncharacterized protein n=1 Tax=Algimonas ampicilliniresistens TaxID=1298735 RepID=A0ABQ5VEJ4_9PROT|nr:hypothetical protein GCM10007853_29890 [Algimonas ampicilliniresistens]